MKRIGILRTRPGQRLVDAALAASAIGLLSTTPASAAPVKASQSDSFVESIGVNVHMSYGGTSPYAASKFPQVEGALRNLGVRYIRDGVGLNRPDVYSRYRALAAAGIKLDIEVGDPLRRWGTGTVDQQLDMIAKEFPEAVATLEGPNEFDNQGDSNWVADLRSYQQALWSGAKLRPALASKPIVGPSLVHANAHNELGDITAWTTQGNMHPYPGGEMPDAEPHTINELRMASMNTSTQPVEATETGYQNAVNGNSGNRPTSEAAAGIYTPRMYLDNFRKGISRTYDYELVDEAADAAKTNAEQNFGLLHYDFSPKPSYTALQRLISLTKDPGPAFDPGSLDYSISGAPSTLRSVLLQKRDGSFYLAVWNAVSVWNTTSLTTVSQASPTVTLNLEGAIEKAEVFRPSEAEGAVSSATDPKSMQLALTPGVTLIRLAPGGTAESNPTPEPESPVEVAPVPGPETPVTSEPVPSPEPVPAPTPIPAPESVPAPPARVAEAPAPSLPPVTAKPVAKSHKRGKKTKRRAIVRNVRGACRRGSPLCAGELARALLRSGTPGRAGPGSGAPGAAVLPSTAVQ